jgi:trehalose-6-phosphate synthase
MQIAVPSREDLAAYRDLRQMVEAIVARINRNFGAANWSPVEYVYGAVDLETLVALYCAADVMLVTSQRDGLNLVAKEFIAARTDGDGVLILSRFAGAAEELSAALQVNPNRISDLADSYYAALTMTPTERRQRMRHLRRAVESNDVFCWAAEFIAGETSPIEHAVGA